MPRPVFYNQGMARLFPFRALRYDSNRIPHMADVVTQPYDKISPEMQDRYYAASPYNLIRVILGKKLEGDTEDGENVYTRAASTLKQWRSEGILKQEDEPALYGYAQTYEVPGRPGEVRERRGFIALAQLHDYDAKVVYRHEQTFPKHKSDRLALFKATRAYCEQIYMLYSDPTFTAERAIFDDSTGHVRKADLEIKDEYGVHHRVWKLTDPALIQRVLAAMQDKELIIADGHHRYETSVGYMHERARELGIDENAEPKSDNGLPAPAFPEQAMMMTFVNMAAPGITILPTHRVVFGLKGFDSDHFFAHAREYFTVTPIQNAASKGPSEEATLLNKLRTADGVAFIAVTKQGDALLKPKSDTVTALLDGLSPRQQQLDVTQLHKVVLEKLLGLDETAVRAGDNVRYLREATEAIEQVRSGKADVAFLIKPVSLAQMRDISLNLEVMPQKSTDFYPKLLSGLAMYTLD
jgi:uncharacterized protein (DUF1015 family)